MLIAGKQLRLALLLLVVIGLAWGSGHFVRDSMEDRESNSMKVESSFRMSMPLFMRNGAAVDDSPSTKTSQPVTTRTTTQTLSTRSDGQCDTITSCMNGGTLQANGTESCPRCQCSYGCSGIICETCSPGSTTTVIPTGSNQKMCLNGGTPVIATNGSYKCNCSQLYRGDFCELSLNCPYSRDSYFDCKNGGELIYSPFTQTCYCSCPPCYHGIGCELYNNNCITSSSANQANATKLTCSTLKCGNYYGMIVQLNETNCKCACRRGYTGEFCELYNTLYWNIECHAGTPYYDPATYTTKCACPLGHYGDNCTYIALSYRAALPTKGSICSTNMCRNGGTLVSGSNGTCRCNCSTYYQGDYCEYAQECYARFGLTCNNGGSPTYNPSLQTCTCSCPSCFYGSNCEFYDSGCNSSSSGSVTQSLTTRPTCSTISCLYGMILQSNSTSCECACARSYSGEYCDLYNTVPVYERCNSVGTLYYDPPSYSFKCTCLQGYYGDSCDYRI